MANLEYVDELYEMDCPKFVDFNVPQDMNDNADEWFNYDHENGIPISFDEENAGCKSHNNVSQEQQSGASSSEEMSVEQMEGGTTTQESSSCPEMLSSSDADEKPKISSSCEDASSAEMSMDSLENTTVEKSTRPNQLHGSEQKSSNPRSHSKQPVTEVAPRPTRKSLRLYTRRSADSARTKRSSISQGTKRRSANPGSCRPIGRGSSIDPPIHKRRKMGNSGSVSSPSEKRPPCPKMKAKLTIPMTPTLLKRKFIKPAQVKSTEELEMEKIEHFRQELVAKRKQSQKSHKAVKESAPVLPTHSETKCTKAEEFKFETDARIKSHPMETRHDARTPNFKGNLRKYGASPMAHHGITKPKPFHFADNRKRSHDESIGGDKKGYEFRSVALAVNQFHTKTPDRFRSKPVSEQNKGPEPAADRPKKAKLTQPRTPALECRHRHRPVTAISQSQREEQEVADMKNYKFKARPVDPRVMSNVSIGVKTVTHKEPTKAIGFDMEIEKRLMEREANKVHTAEERYEFRARPLPVKILAGTVGIAEARPLPVTLPMSPAFALKNRMKVYEEKEREKEEREHEHDNSHLIRARPAMHVGVPFIPSIQHKKTEVEPFSFDDKIRESKARKEAKLQELLREEEKARQFRAQPLPDASCSGVPEKKVKPPTQLEPFNVAERGAKQAEEWSKKMEEEMRECKRLASAFKAKPANILYEEPFIPEKSAKPMTDISNFSLNTERRAEERKEFQQNLYERQSVLEAALAQREIEKQEEIRNEINKQRADAVHRANPIRQYKMVDVLPSTKQLTQPKTPNFSDRTRRVSHV